MKVLIVNNDPELRELLKKVLQSRGHEVTSYSDAQTALSAFKRDPYPLIILDWIHPDMDGLDLLRKFRRLPQGDYSVILMLTVRDEPENINKALEAGASDYVTKPVNREALNIRIAVAERQVHNIIMRQQAKQNLLESEIKYRTLVEELPAITYIADAKNPTKVYYISPQIETMLGYTQTEWINTRDIWVNRLHPDDRDRVLAYFKRALNDSKRFISVEYRMVARNGSISSFRDEATLVLDEQGQPIFVQGVMLDITDQMLMEDNLRDTGEKFRQLAENIREVFWMTEPDKNEMIYISPGYEEIWGRKVESLYQSPRSWLDSIHSGDRDRVLKAALTKQVRGDYDEEYRIQRPDGSVRWIRDRAFPIRDKDGIVNRIAGIAEDITDLKEANEVIRKNEQLFKSVLTAVPDLMLILDAEGRYREIFTADHELLFLPAEEILGKTIHEILPEDLARAAQKVIDQTLKTGKPQQYDYSLETTGVHRWFSARSVKFEWEGDPCVLWLARDATEKKQAEYKIEKSHADLLAILNQLRIGTVETDANGHVTFLNRTCQQLIGKKLSQAIGRHWEELCPFSPKIIEATKKMMLVPLAKRNKVTANLERTNGKQVQVEIEIQDDPRDPNGKIFYFYDVSEVYDLRQMLDEKSHYGELVGKSKAMQQVYAQIKEISGLDWTVLITGETGTGKELVARAIHTSSPRKDKPFIAINCAGLTDSILTSQLFGHKRGAFTGAVSDQKGLIEAANGGTLFLDEIGDVSMNVQTSLLRVLEAKEVTRLGETQPRKIDARVIVATHRDLNEEVAKGRFRADLLYRIRIARIELAPLRERREDIPLLIRTLLGQSRASSGKPVEDIANDAMRALLDYQWPGNVRELKSAIDVAVIHSKGPIIKAEDLPGEIVQSAQLSPKEAETPLDEIERMFAVLQTTEGNRSKAARLLGMSRATFYRKLASLNIKPQ
jgi:PAS domain S-box-containing protein